MASSAAKKRAKANQTIILTHAAITLAVLLLYSIYRIYFEWETFTFWYAVWYSLILGVYAICLKLIADYGKPFNNGADVNSLSEIPKGSLTEYFFDILYITWFVQLGSIISVYFWYILAVIPIFAVYRVWSGLISPMLAQRKMLASLAENADEDDDSGLSRRQQKLKAREDKMQSRMRK